VVEASFEFFALLSLTGGLRISCHLTWKQAAAVLDHTFCWFMQYVHLTVYYPTALDVSCCPWMGLFPVYGGVARMY
jgi:hypothetical protein